MVKDGKRVLSEEDISKAEKVIEKEAAFAGTISRVGNLNEALECIRESFGAEATFRSFLQEVKHMDLPDVRGKPS